MLIEDLKVTRPWQSGAEGESKAERPGNQKQQSAYLCCAVCSIHEYIKQSMRMNL
jgi:hypothetical protein